MISWINKPDPQNRERVIGLSFVSRSALGCIPYRHHIRVYELKVTNPESQMVSHLTRGQYHSLEHILIQEALENLGPECISVSGSGDNKSYRFVVTGKIYKKELAKFLMTLIYDGATKYVALADVPYINKCSFGKCHEIGDLFTKLSTTLCPVLMKYL